MMEIWVYAFLSVFLVSLMSLIGIFTLSIKLERLNKFLLYMVSFSAGALFGDAFIHLLPEAVDVSGFNLQISIYIISGITFFFIIEKFVHWRHCHNVECTGHNEHAYVKMNIYGDALHNFIDGLIIGASYLVSIPTGVATTVAIFLHEIPQEIGDFGVMIHGGYSKNKALLYNFLTAMTSFVGLFIALIIGGVADGLIAFIIPFAAGGFIYIAGSDLIPELHKEVGARKSMLQLITFIFGIIVMTGLLFVE